MHGEDVLNYCHVMISGSPKTLHDFEGQLFILLQYPLCQLRGRTLPPFQHFSLSIGEELDYVVFHGRVERSLAISVIAPQ